MRKLSWKHFHICNIQEHSSWGNVPKDELHTFPNHTSLVKLFPFERKHLKTQLRFPWKVHWNMCKFFVVHCICTLVRSVPVSYSVITIPSYVRVCNYKKMQILRVKIISTIVKIPIQTTKRIKASELLNSFSVFPFISAISHYHKLPTLTWDRCRHYILIKATV